jgi:hypothetical protein
MNKNYFKIIKYVVLIMSRDSSVGIATDWTAGVWFLSEVKASIPALGPIQPSVQRLPGAVCPGVKWQGREADPKYITVVTRACLNPFQAIWNQADPRSHFLSIYFCVIPSISRIPNNSFSSGFQIKYFYLSPASFIDIMYTCPAHLQSRSLRCCRATVEP